MPTEVMLGLQKEANLKESPLTKFGEYHGFLPFLTFFFSRQDAVYLMEYSRILYYLPTNYS